MKLIDYYEDEIRYFLEEARRFSRRYPDRAKALNLEEVKERDPYVERLIEAFAFLSGNINKRLNDDFSQLAQELIETLWPHYLSPLPGAVILQLSPIAGRLKKSVELAPGVWADSVPVSMEQSCRFTTTSGVAVKPLVISHAAMVGRRDGRSALRIGFNHLKGSRWADVGEGEVSIYLHGDPGFAFSLYYMLLQDTEGILVRYGKGEEGIEIPLGRDRIRSLRFNGVEDSPLIPGRELAFPGFRLLEEYFFFPEKFRFVDVDFLDVIGAAADGMEVQVDFLLSGRMDWRLNPDASAFRLHCVPAVNMYPKGAEPIYLDDAIPTHKIVADQGHPDHHVPHHILRVEGIRLEDSQRCLYPSFLSYGHESENGMEDSYYHFTRQVGVDGVPEMHLGIHRPIGVGAEIISVDLMCSNGDKVREVKLGDVKHPGDTVPDFVSITNVTTPKAPVWPNIEGRELWTLVHHLSLNYLSLDDPDRLRSLISFYDREKSRANQRRTEGIVSVSIVPSEILFKGYPLRGIDMDMVLDERHFTGQGDVLMFSHVISRMMSMYVPINSFCNLSVRELNTENIYTWPGIKGMQAVL